MNANMAQVEADINSKIESAAGENQYLTFILDGEEYGVDILRVQEIKGWESVTPLPNVPKYVKGVMNLRGTIVPVVCLRRRFGMPEALHQEQVRYEFDPKIIEDSFLVLAPYSGAIVSDFYDRLFSRHEDVHKLFANVSREDQERKLLITLKTIVANLRQPSAIRKILALLGEKHQKYGALPQHYPVVVELLLELMQEHAAEQWHESYTQAWRSALSAVAQGMLSAYKSDELSKTVVVVLRVESNDRARTVGMIVDAVSDVYSIAEQQISPPPSFGGEVMVDCVAGMATLDEKMVIMLDIDSIIEFGDTQ